MSRLPRRFALLIAAAVLYAGPVVACVCVDDHSMPEMPCCPDQAHDATQPADALPVSLVAACAPASAAGLPACEPQPPAPVFGLFVETPVWRPPEPPWRPQSDLRLGFSGPPVYLVTQRLRH